MKKKILAMPDLVLSDFRLPSFNKFRRENGLTPRKNIWDIWRGDLNLIVDIPEYGPTEGLPENFYYIGPIVWEPAFSPPGWVETLDSDKPTIYFTMGSTGYARFFEQARTYLKKN